VIGIVCRAILLTWVGVAAHGEKLRGNCRVKSFRGVAGKMCWRRVLSCLLFIFASKAKATKDSHVNLD
jgi:hypothetical protein